MNWEAAAKSLRKSHTRRANWWLLGACIGTAMQIGWMPSAMTPGYAIGTLVVLLAYGQVRVWEDRAKRLRGLQRDMRAGRVSFKEADQ